MPVITDRLPTLGAAPVGPERGRRVLGRLLARPSLPALVGLVVVVVVFGIQAPALLTSGGLASVLDVAALLGIGAVAVSLLLIAGQFDLSVGVVAVATSLVTALLIAHAGWGTWPALAGSLAVALAVGLINGFLVVNTGLPSFLVTLATFLVLQGTSQAGAQAVAGSARVAGLEDAEGWNSASAVFGATMQLGDGRFRDLAGVVAGGDGPGVLGAVAHPLRQRASSPAAAPAAPPVSSASPSGGRRWRCSASPPRPAG